MKQQGTVAGMVPRDQCQVQVATLYPWLRHLSPARRYGVMLVASDANWAMSMQAFSRGQPGVGLLLGGGLALWFPGFLNFIESLSKLDSLPASWITSLKSSRGVYLLTCNKNRAHTIIASKAI